MILAWWNEQSLRDRRVIVIGSVVVAIFLAWSFVWHPLASEHARLANQLDNALSRLARTVCVPVSSLPRSTC